VNEIFTLSPNQAKLKNYLRAKNLCKINNSALHPTPAKFQNLVKIGLGIPCSIRLSYGGTYQYFLSFETGRVNTASRQRRTSRRWPLWAAFDL
jgi:hypothetical protein